VGEVELVGTDVRGVAVHQAARIMALAASDEIFVSDLTRALAVGSGLSSRTVECTRSRGSMVSGSSTSTSKIRRPHKQLGGVCGPAQQRQVDDAFR
jgi:hypothetical protein